MCLYCLEVGGFRVGVGLVAPKNKSINIYLKRKEKKSTFTNANTLMEYPSRKKIKLKGYPVR